MGLEVAQVQLGLKRKVGSEVTYNSLHFVSRRHEVTNVTSTAVACPVRITL